MDDCSTLPFAADILALARQHSLIADEATSLELVLRLHLPLAAFDRPSRRCTFGATTAVAWTAQRAEVACRKPVRQLEGLVGYLFALIPRLSQ
jgi:hypothetical protein